MKKSNQLAQSQLIHHSEVPTLTSELVEDGEDASLELAEDIDTKGKYSSMRIHIQRINKLLDARGSWSNWLTTFSLLT
jgi:hypothetical protein